MTSAHAFRVVAGSNPWSAKRYEGDDIRAALAAFYEALPDGPCLMRHDVHSVTGEPMIEVRDALTGKMVAALYGVTAAEWRAALAQNAALFGEGSLH